MRENIRVLEGLGQLTTSLISPTGPELEIPAPFGVDVSRSVSRLASAYDWRQPEHRAAFELCARHGVQTCLSLADAPQGKGFDPAIKTLLLGGAAGYALAKGGGALAAVGIALWFMRGKTLGDELTQRIREASGGIL